MFASRIRWTVPSLVVGLGLFLVFAGPGTVAPLGWDAPAFAQEHDDHGGAGGHSGGQRGGGGHETDDGHATDDHGHEPGGGAIDDAVFRGQRRGGEAAPGREGDHGPSTEDAIFRGRRPADAGEEEEDSDRRGPQYGGGESGQPREPGSKMGDLYGDLWVILRDANGVPILNEDGFVQPIDADGNLIPLDEEGQPIDESLVIEVELGRQNVGRSPTTVADRSLAEAIATLASAEEITFDAAGRLVVTVPVLDENGDPVLEEKTIDSPLENLALYEELMTAGNIVDDQGTEDPADDVVLLGGGTSLSAADYTLAASLYAAAADKAGEILLDEVVYLNAILGIPGTIVVGDETYVDYSDFDYDRATVFDGDVTFLRETEPGVWVEVTEPIMTAVFDGENYTSDDGGIDGWAQLADDARAVIEFVHDNQIPE